VANHKKRSPACIVSIFPLTGSIVAYRKISNEGGVQQHRNWVVDIRFFADYVEYDVDNVEI
jgi:hypothetical protein